jgi:predicted amino acid-binding ACT domain protein
MGILGDEEGAAIRASLAQLHLKVTALEDQMRSQYTSLAAYASIAQEQVEFTRDEARADLDRTRQTLIELVEQVRMEASAVPRTRVPGAPPGPLAPPIVTAPSPALAARLGEFEQAIMQCFDRQRELAETLAAVLDIVSAPATDAPISGLAFT